MIRFVWAWRRARWWVHRRLCSLGVHSWQARQSHGRRWLDGCRWCYATRSPDHGKVERR